MKTRMSYILLIVFFSLSTYSSTLSPKVIYGEDNRQEVIDVTDNKVVNLSKSVAAMMKQSQLKKVWTSSDFKLVAKTLEQRGMCASERFSSQPSAANCTGFLVGENKLVTAGHCIKSQSDCENTVWVFDFKLNSEDQKEFTVSPKNVFKCSKIISRALSKSDKDDYALIELDRVAKGREPLAFRKSGKVSTTSEVLVIGHPSGLPMKITDSAKVRALKDKFFVTNLDTYGGNSGSPVFDADTGLVEGILVRGERDFVTEGGCRVSNRVGEDDGRGEDVTYITNIKELMN